jgi:hypothetical protein
VLEVVELSLLLVKKTEVSFFSMQPGGLLQIFDDQVVGTLEAVVALHKSLGLLKAVDQVGLGLEVLVHRRIGLDLLIL